MKLIPIVIVSLAFGLMGIAFAGLNETNEPALTAEKFAFTNAQKNLSISVANLIPRMSADGVSRYVAYQPMWQGDLTIDNKSKWPIKDIVVRCSKAGGSGTEADHSTFTMFEVVPPFTSQLFRGMMLGDRNDALPNISVSIEDFTLVDFKAPRLATPAELALLKQKQAEVKQAEAKSKLDSAAKTLAWHQELAAKGDAYGQYKMGLRYLTGDGVPKDTNKARALLAAAASQGNQDATTQLAKLDKP